MILLNSLVIYCVRGFWVYCSQGSEGKKTGYRYCQVFVFCGFLSCNYRSFMLGCFPVCAAARYVFLHNVVGFS